MVVALGHLRWPPQVFWRCTIKEFDAAQRGYLQSKGVDTDTSDRMQSSRLAELMARYPDEAAPYGPDTRPQI